MDGNRILKVRSLNNYLKYNMKLSEIKIGNCCIIKKVYLNYKFKNYLFNLGFIENNYIKVLYKNFGNSLIACKVYNSIFAIRIEHAYKIEVFLVK